MAEDDPEEYPEPIEIIGTPTVERMAEIWREIAQKIDAMSPAERAEYLTVQTFERQRADEEQFAGKSSEERHQILEMREDFHDRIRERTRDRSKRLIRVPSLSVTESPFPWLDPTPEGLLGAEDALKAKRDNSYRRPKPRSDGW